MTNRYRFTPLLFSLLLIVGCSTESTPVYTLETSVSPDGAGQITPSQGEYDEGTNVEVAAVANEHWVFESWSGDFTSTSNPDSVTITEDMSVTALFVKKEYELKMETEGEGTIHEQVMKQKTSEYEHGTVVQLTADPDEGWEFSHWEGDLEGENEVKEIEIDDEKSVTAVFERIEYALTINVEGEGDVIEEIIQAKSTDYPYGTTVELTAEPDDGWRFAGWEGDLTGDENPAEIVIEEEKSVTAQFEEVESELNILTDGSGDVETNLISGSETSDGQYEYNSVVELTATPESGWLFSRWEEDLSGSDDVVEVTMDSDKTVVAVFQEEGSNEINLIVGETYTHEFPGGSVILPDQTNAVYRVGVVARDYQRSEARVLEVQDGLMLKTSEVGGGLAKHSLLADHHTHREPYFDDKIDRDIWELMQRTQQTHRELRDAEERGVAEGVQYTAQGEPSRLGPASHTKWSSGAEPEENRTFYANNPDGGERLEIEATLRKNGTNVIYYQDDTVEGTNEEATDREIEDLLEYYDQHGKPVIDEMFGGLGPNGTTNHFTGGERPADDIDGNGKFIVLQLHPDHMIGEAAGYVTACDRFPLEENYNAGSSYCDRSNEAEITYILRPDSDYFLGVLVHEAKHISSHGYAVFAGRGFQPSWIEEGTAEISNEMASRRASGFSDHHQVTFSDIYPGGSTTSLTDAMASVNSRARSFLNASPESGLIGDPDDNSAGSDYYGSAWLFHRYLADNYASNNQNGFFRNLNDGTYGTDISSFTSATGKEFEELIAEFLTAIQIEGSAEAMSNSSVSFNSYDFEEIASNFSTGEWPYLYGESDYSSSETELSPVYFTSPTFFEFTAPGGSTLELELLSGDGEPLDADHDGALIITRIE